MDFLNRAFAQISDLFKSLSPGARISSGLLLVVIIVSLAYLFRSNASGPDTYLMGGQPFSAAELPAMEAAFSAAGLTGCEIDGNRIKVPRGQQTVYMGALADAGVLPANFGSYLEKALTNDGPWTPKAKREESLKVAKQRELQLILCSMKGIEAASVIYDEKKAGGFSQQTMCTASVAVKPIGSRALDKEQVSMIRHSVASAFAGLRPENVSVSDLNGRIHSAKSSDGKSSDVSDDGYLALKEAYLELYQSSVSNQLAYIPGVVATVNVDLFLDTDYEETKTILDPKTVIYESDKSTSSKTSEAPGPAGRPGLAAQQPPGGANQPGAVGIASTGSKMSEETSHTQNNTAIPTTVQKRRQAGMTPKQVKVAVAIPTSYYDKIWQERNPAAAGQEPKQPDAAALAEIERQVNEKVKNQVVTLLPPHDPTKDPFPQVTVESFQHIVSATPAPPALQEQALAWVGQYWTTLGTGGLALVSLIVLRSVVRSGPKTTAASAMAVTSESNYSTSLSLVAGDDGSTDDASPNSEPTTPRSRLKRRVGNGPSLREELAVMVKEDPDSAVAVLRNWIGTGA
jgi:flagellar M-ring protein FliF